MVPGKARLFRDARGTAVGCACLKEVIGIGEHGERRRSGRVGRDHMEQLHLHWIGHVLGKCVGITRYRVHGCQLPHGTLKRSSYSLVIASWIARDIDVGSRVRMNQEWVCDALLSRQQACHIGIDFTDLAIGARRRHPIASCRTWGATHEMITLVGREYEQRIARIDAVTCQSSEEPGEGVIICCECRDIASLAGAVSW